MVSSCNPSSQKTEVEESVIQGHPGLHSKTLYQSRTLKYFDLPVGFMGYVWEQLLLMNW